MGISDDPSKHRVTYLVKDIQNSSLKLTMQTIRREGGKEIPN